MVMSIGCRRCILSNSELIWNAIASAAEHPLAYIWQMNRAAIFIVCKVQD